MSTFNVQLFIFILGIISLCISTSASDTKETTKQNSIDPKLENKWNEKLDYMYQWMEQMEANQTTGSSAINKIETNVEKLMNMVEQGLKKIEENSKKIEKCEGHFSEKLDNNSKKIEDLTKKMDEKMNVTRDDVMSEVKCESKVNISKAECKVQLEQLEAQLTLANHTALNVCPFNLCNGGQCKVNATGSGFSCSNCPFSTYGTHCEKLKCDKENNCMKYKNTLYFVFESELNWREANRKCEAEGMTLAMPKEQESNEWLVSQLRAIYGYDVMKTEVYLWLGLKSDASGEYRWTDGSPLEEYTGGHSNFNSNTYQYCGLLYLFSGSSMWFPTVCTNRNQPLCEKRIFVN